MFRRLCLTIASAAAGLAHYRRQYAAVAAGALLAATLFSGSLVTGASVQKSLEQTAVDRLRKIEYALRIEEGFFPATLAARLGSRLRTRAVPALALRGQAAPADSAAALRRVDVLGVVDSFFGLFTDAKSGLSLAPTARSAVLGARAAAVLGCRTGDEIVLRVEKPSLLPLESLAGRTDDRFVSLRLTVSAVLPAARGGAFGLAADQASPLDVFVPWELLARSTGLRGKANLLLLKERSSGRIPIEETQLALKSEMRLADYGIDLGHGPKADSFEARDDRLFLRPQTEEAAAGLDPAARGRLVYFVNRLKAAPYSFMAAVAPADLPVALKNDEIIVSDWLAADQGLGRGSTVTIAYYAIDERATLVEREARFRVRAVLPQTHPLFDARRTPNFPGLTDAAACRDWKAGVPLDFATIRPKDEAFWNRFRAAPKAAIGLEAGQALWANRFGKLTSLAFTVKQNDGDAAGALLERINPADFGFSFRPVRLEARAAAANSVDFTGLFAGLSLFAVAAGLLLAAFLFSAAAAGRRRELGLLRAVGFSRGRALRRLGLEGAAVALAGSAVGSLLGLGFTAVMILLLKTLFRGAIGDADLGFYISWPHFGAGLGGSFVFALSVFIIALIRETRRPIVVLLSGSNEGHRRRKRPRPIIRLAVAVIAIGIAFGLTLGFQKKGLVPEYFFISSGLVFIGLLLFFDALLIGFRRRQSGFPGSPVARAWAALRAHRGRTVANVLALALGIFLVTAVGANTSSLPIDPDRRDTGTGGFALFAETLVSVPENLNDPAARARLGLADLPAGVSFVPIRVRSGDDASCLNLNRAQEPEVIGVDPAALAGRRAFAFRGTTVAFRRGASGWSALEYAAGSLAPAGPIPAAADETSLEWSLGLALGDEIKIADEAGRERHLRLSATFSDSLFQGSIVISEDEFLRLFPSSPGYSRFLVDAPGFSAEARRALAGYLQNTLRAYGIEVMTAEARLFQYHRVADTYLLMFLILGGLGLLLGLGGFGVLIRQAVAARRGEIAFLRAIGTPTRTVWRALLAEQYLTLAGALMLGLLASLVALLPIVLKAADRLPWAIVIGLFIAMAALGFAWARRSLNRSLRGDLIGVLKNE